MQITKVEKIVITNLLMDDETAAKAFCLSSENAAGTIRREMSYIPRFNKYLGNYGNLIDPEGFKEYLMYRGTPEHKEELAKYKKISKK